MHRTAYSEINGQQLMRIVALLLSFASLADRACRAPLPVRVAVMFFLLPAESVAREFVTGLTASFEPAPGSSGDHAESAARLAERFGALAAVLSALAAGLSACCREQHDVPSARACRNAADALVRRLGHALPRPRPVDTS